MINQQPSVFLRESCKFFTFPIKILDSFIPVKESNLWIWSNPNYLCFQGPLLDQSSKNSFENILRTIPVAWANFLRRDQHRMSMMSQTKQQIFDIDAIFLQACSFLQNNSSIIRYPTANCMLWQPASHDVIYKFVREPQGASASSLICNRKRV